MNKLKAIFSYFKGYIDKSLASNAIADKEASDKIKQSVDIILGRKS
jgi:hypothetical protein